MLKQIFICLFLILFLTSCVAPKEIVAEKEPLIYLKSSLMKKRHIDTSINYTVCADGKIFNEYFGSNYKYNGIPPKLYKHNGVADIYETTSSLPKNAVSFEDNYTHMETAERNYPALPDTEKCKIEYNLAAEKREINFDKCRKYNFKLENNINEYKFKQKYRYLLIAGYNRKYTEIKDWPYEELDIEKYYSTTNNKVGLTRHRGKTENDEKIIQAIKKEKGNITELYKKNDKVFVLSLEQKDYIYFLDIIDIDQILKSPNQNVENRIYNLLEINEINYSQLLNKFETEKQLILWALIKDRNNEYHFTSMQFKQQIIKSDSYEELCSLPLTDNNYVSVNEDVDSDNDGLADYIEWIIDTDPNSDDTDKDGYSDKTEFLLGGLYMLY